MKKTITFAIITWLTFGSALSAAAKNHHEHDNNRHRHEYYQENSKHCQHDDDRWEHDREYRGYYNNREVAYRQYIRRYHKRYRDHDRWYYSQRFYNRNNYVYFSRYRTYYDPYQRVYIYKTRNRWVRTETMPAFLVGINFGNVAVQFLSRLPY